MSSSILDLLLKELEDDETMKITITKNKQKADLEFKDSKSVSSCDLDMRKPLFPEKDTASQKDVLCLRHVLTNQLFFENEYQYFFTIAFPHKESYSIKHLEIKPNGKYEYSFKPIQFQEATPDEQYQWMLRILDKNISLIADCFDIFFESCKSGDLHIHGRLFSKKGISTKTIKTYIHRMFNTPSKYKNFVDIKVYKHDKWESYDQKTKKEYQTTKYKHFKNVEYVVEQEQYDEFCKLNPWFTKKYNPETHKTIKNGLIPPPQEK